jgi:hypothetical protein
MLCRGVVGRPGDFVPIPGLPHADVSYGPAALSVDGRDLATGREANAPTARQELLIGALGGHLRSIWRSPSPQASVVQLVWLPGDRSLLADVGVPTTTTANLELITDTGRQHVIERDIDLRAGFAAI